jgi:mRNA interferase MazF
MSASVQQGSVYWFQDGEKKRPMLVLSRDSAIPFLQQVMIAPITKKVLEVPSFIKFHSDELGEVAVNLDAVQCVEKTKLSGFIARLSQEQMQGVRHAVSFAMGFDDLEGDG